MFKPGGRSQPTCLETTARLPGGTTVLETTFWKQPLFTHAARGSGVPKMGLPTLEPVDARENLSFRVNKGLVHIDKEKPYFSLADSPIPDIVNLKVRPAVVSGPSIRSLRPLHVHEELSLPLVTYQLRDPLPSLPPEDDEPPAPVGSPPRKSPTKTSL